MFDYFNSYLGNMFTFQGKRSHYNLNILRHRPIIRKTEHCHEEMIVQRWNAVSKYTEHMLHGGKCRQCDFLGSQAGEVIGCCPYCIFMNFILKEIIPLGEVWDYSQPYCRLQVNTIFPNTSCRTAVMSGVRLCCGQALISKTERLLKSSKLPL